MIELSGTISGGGRPQKGGMSSKVVEEISESQISEAQDALRKKKEEIIQIRGQMSDLTTL